MRTAARHTISVWRNDEFFEYPIRIVGVDLGSLDDYAMDIRSGPDAPGPALVALRKTENPNADGLRLVSVSVDSGVPTSHLRLQLTQATRQSLPYSGVLDAATKLAYAAPLWGGRTRLYGDFLVLAHSYGSDNAPSSRPASRSNTLQHGSPQSGATLTVSTDEFVQLDIDGAGTIAPLAAKADAAAARAQAAAEEMGQTAASIIAEGKRVDQAVALIEAQATNIPYRSEMPTHAHAFADAEGRVIGGFLADGSFDGQPSERFRETANYVGLGEVPGFMLGVHDAAYRFLGGITEGGELDLPLTEQRRAETNYLTQLANADFAFAVLDAEFKLIWGVYADGTTTGGGAGGAVAVDPSALVFDNTPLTYGQTVRIVSKVADPVGAMAFPTRAVGRQGVGGTAAPTLDLTTTGFTHPCVCYVPGGWNGFPYWMALTPYFGPPVNADSQYENPHVFCSLDGKSWQEPGPGVNPLDLPNPSPDQDYWSDTEIHLADDGYMYVLYRGNGPSRGGRNVVYRRSRDGTNWSPRMTVYDTDTLASVGSANAILSPAFLKHGQRWICFDVNLSSDAAGNLVITPQKNQSGQFLFRRDAPALASGWEEYSLDQVVGLTNRPWSSSHDPWHVHACKVGNLWLLAINVGPTGASGGESLWLAWSADGWAFTVIEQPLFSSATYRSCLCPTGFDSDGRLDVRVYQARTDDGTISLHHLKLEISE